MPLIRNVSDTAHWVARYRALESARPDALFHDPFAERLAGARGREIVEGLHGGVSWGWPMVVRTAVMDEIITREVAAGVDTVVLLAAGLDMRPYRLALPASLRWVDVDLPAMVAEKLAAIAGETPHCTVERIAADLADPAARRDALTRALAGSKRALVVAEGLLIYLGADDVAALAADLAAQPAAALWLIDLAHPQLLKWMAPRWGKVVAEGGAPFRFAPEAGTGFFAPYGWSEREWRSAILESRRLHREMPGAWFWRFMGLFSTPVQKEVQRRFSGYALLERIPSAPKPTLEAR
jgi:methyltransferase (TIGR00027 family)